MTKLNYPLTPIHLQERNEEFTDEYEEFYAMMQQPRYIPVEKTGHDYLRNLCEAKNVYSSSTPQLVPITNRVLFIINALNEMKLNYQLDVFGADAYDSHSYSEPKAVNVIVEFKSPFTQPAVVFSAHHDVNNIHSDNAQDNSASVCNLLDLCSRLSKETVIQKRTIVVFTDKEECGGVGARRFAKKAKANEYGEIDYIINLELTGLGNKFWVDSNNHGADINSKATQRLVELFGEKMWHHKSTPFSDAMPFRSNGLDAVCIGIVPETDNSDRPKLWGICHSMTDSFDKTNKNDMTEFVNVLFQVVQGKIEEEQK